MKKIIIQKEDAVFRMNSDGEWCNEHGRFEHPKIIKYFHSAIRKDGNGYFVCQKTDEFEEKVYFPYEDTAMFVFDIIFDDPAMLVLNTGDTLVLNPEQLVQENDSLYIDTPDHRIKFTQKSLIKLSGRMSEKDGALWLNLNDQTWEIKETSA